MVVVSNKSIITFFSVNTTLVFISLVIDHVTRFHKNIVVIFFTYVLRNYFLLLWLTVITNKKTVIHNNNKCKLKDHLYLFSTTFLDTITSIFIISNLKLNKTSNLIYFIPKSFLFELILDFFHYITHRSLHNRYLRFIHSTHHKHLNPQFINSYYFNPLDVIITINIPMILSISILPVSLFEFTLLSVYKQYTELAGHSGKRLSPCSCFPQCIWLPRLLGIQLYSEDHYLHHRLNNYNFAKRFSLWDKLFGTYLHNNVI